MDTTYKLQILSAIEARIILQSWETKPGALGFKPSLPMVCASIAVHNQCNKYSWQWKTTIYSLCLNQEDVLKQEK